MVRGTITQEDDAISDLSLTFVLSLGISFRGV